MFYLRLWHEVPLKEFFISLLLQEKLFDNIGIVIYVGEVLNHGQTYESKERLKTSKISNSLNPGCSLDGHVFHKLVKFY